MDNNFSLNNGGILYDIKTDNNKNETVTPKNPYSAKLNSYGSEKDTVTFTSKKQKNKTFIDKVKGVFKKDENGNMSSDGKAAIVCTVLGIGAAAGLFMLFRSRGSKASNISFAGNILDLNNPKAANVTAPITTFSTSPTDAITKQMSKNNSGHRHSYKHHHSHRHGHSSNSASVDIPRLDDMTLPKREPFAPMAFNDYGALPGTSLPSPPTISPDDFLTKKVLSNADVDKFLDNLPNPKKTIEKQIQNEEEFKEALLEYCDKGKANSSKLFDYIVNTYKDNDGLAEILRLTAHKNYFGNCPMDFENFYDLINVAKIADKGGKIDTDTLKQFIKLESHRRGSIYGNLMASSAVDNFELFKNNKKFCAAIADINPGKKDFQMDPYRILRKAKENNRNPEEIIEFLNSLKQGNVLNKFEKLEVGMLLNPDFDLKIGTKFMNSLNGDIKGRLDIEAIQKIITDPNINAKRLSQKLNNLPKDIVSKFTPRDAEGFMVFNGRIGASNINELNMAEKKLLLRNIVRANSDLFNEGQGVTSELFPLLPKNKDEYCSLLQKLTKSIGIDTKPLTQAEQKAFDSGLKHAANSISKANLEDITFSLDKSRQDFISKTTKAMKNLNDTEKRRVMDYFGFELVDIIPDRRNGLKHTLHAMKGYPINVNNGAKLAEIESAETKKVIENVRKIVTEFSEDNAIKLVNKSGAKLTKEQQALEADLNEVFKGLPELRSIIGRKQHQTHIFSLDEHTFRVFQGVAQNPKFEKLSESDKKVLSIASLLHDITKAEGLRDASHPIESAFDAFYITQKLNLSENEKVKVYELIKSHNWLDRMCAKTKDGAGLSHQEVQRLAQDVAFDARHSNTFELAKILCEADMKAVKPNGAFFEKHKGSFNEMSAYVDKYLEKIHNSQIILPQTRIPKASAIQNGVQKSANGITNTVLYMDDISGDLSKYGFKKGTTKENLRALVHALDDKDQMSKFDTFSLIDSDALLSTSYIDAENYKVFRKQGFVLDVDYNDIHAGYYRDFGTGCKKDLELLKSDYLFFGNRAHTGTNMSEENRTKFRNYIPNLIKEAMGITDDKEYANMVKQIQDAKSITEIEEKNPKLAKALNDVFASMEAGKRRGGRQYNEMLASRPKIQAVFGYDKEYEKIPKFLREYAQDNDIPVLIFGKPVS